MEIAVVPDVTGEGRMRRRGAPSFVTFYETSYRDAVTLAALLVHDRHRAADVVQDAMAEAYVRWAQISAFDRPDLWLRRVVINRCISRGRRARSEAAALQRVRAATPDPVAEASLDVGAWAQVRNLPARQAQAMALVYGCDMSVGDAAVVMACSQGSVKTHLSRGRAALATILSEEQT